MNKCLLSRPGLIAGPLHSTPFQFNSQSIPRLDPIDSKSSFSYKLLHINGNVQSQGIGQHFMLLSSCLILYPVEKAK